MHTQLSKNRGTHKHTHTVPSSTASTVTLAGIGPGSAYMATTRQLLWYAMVMAHIACASVFYVRERIFQRSIRKTHIYVYWLALERLAVNTRQIDQYRSTTTITSRHHQQPLSHEGMKQDHEHKCELMTQSLPCTQHLLPNRHTTYTQTHNYFYLN